MKKTIVYSLLTVLSLSFSITDLDAQKSADRSVYCKFIQLPSHPLNTNKYDYIVYQNGETGEPEVSDGEGESIKEAFKMDINYYYERLSEIDQKMYEIGNSEELSGIKKQLKMGEINNSSPEHPKRPKLKYEDEMELYIIERKLYDGRIDSLNNSGLNLFFKEQIRSIIQETQPSKPVLIKHAVVKKYSIPNGQVAELMNIRGLERDVEGSNKNIFEIYMAEFESKIKQKKSLNGKVNDVLKCRRIISYKVYDESQTLLDEGMVPGTDKWREKSYSTDSDHSKEISATKKEFEQTTATEGLRDARDFLAEKYAYPILTHYTKLSFPKGKKYDYESFVQTYEKVKAFLEESLKSDNPNLQLLRESIEVWQEALKEADYTEKNARISADIANGFYFDIIECSIWLNDFDKAFSLIEKVKSLNTKNKVLEHADYLKGFLEDRKQRYDANVNAMTNI